jgi:hypothetical protein
VFWVLQQRARAARHGPPTALHTSAAAAGRCSTPLPSLTPTAAAAAAAAAPQDLFLLLLEMRAGPRWIAAAGLDALRVRQAAMLCNMASVRYDGAMMLAAWAGQAMQAFTAAAAKVLLNQVAEAATQVSAVTARTMTISLRLAAVYLEARAWAVPGQPPQHVLLLAALLLGHRQLQEALEALLRGPVEMEDGVMASAMMAQVGRPGRSGSRPALDSGCCAPGCELDGCCTRSRLGW